MKQPEDIIIALVISLPIILSGIAILVWRHLRSKTLPAWLSGLLGLLALCGSMVIATLLFLVFVLVLGPFGLIWWGAIVFVIVEWVRKHRAARQYGLLWLLAVSSERFMPLVPAIDAFAREHRGAFSRRARRLAGMLNAGVPLPDALDRCPGLLPRYAVPMIRVGYETGTLAPSLRQAATVHDLHEPIWAAITGITTYLLMLPAFGILLLTFLMIKIIPSFEKIFKDFGTALPSMTQALISASNFAVNYWFLLLPFYLVGALLVIHATLRYFGWIDTDLPGIARLTRRFDSARVLDTLALVARQRRPLTEGIAALAHSYPKQNVRWRLAMAAVGISAGRDWCESLREQDLIRHSDLAILQAAQRVGNLPWALHEMADSNRRRLAYRVQAAAQVLFPPMIIAMGLVVMFIVVALFLPLIALIQHMV